MVTTKVSAADQVQDLVRFRQRRELGDLDYRRALRRATDAGFSQRQLAAVLHIKQPSVHSALKNAVTVSEPLEGFSGATPTEICQRFAAEHISREVLVDELTRFPYVEAESTDGYDSLLVNQPGTWSEVSAAVRRGLIDRSVYEDVFAARHPEATR
ncbi:hypothetical protein [Aeromicrobium sp. CF3.5]|uniref:hypothetical protein n=1 Tax=Aeromicrobium sp. CF3.5 TaxID=3373078 RepID=UPI003EE5B8FD